MGREADPADRRYRWALLVVVLVGLAVRLAFVYGPAEHVALAGDSSTFYRPVAESLADLDGFTVADPQGRRTPVATLPPLFPVVLAAHDLVGLDSVRGQQVGLAVLGSLALVAVAELGRRLHGRKVAIVAASVAALDPLWITHTAALMSEALVLILVPLVLLAALWCIDAPSLRRYAVLGFLLGLAILNRTDAIVLAALLAAAVFAAVRQPIPRRLGGLALTAGVVVVMLVPWSIRNKAEVDSWNLALNGGPTTSGSNCSATYYQPGLVGSWDINCSIGAALSAGHTAGKPLSPAELDDAMTEWAVDYARENRDRLPTVVSARVRRTWGVYPIDQQMRLAHQEGRSLTWERRGLELWRWLLVPFAVGVVVTVWRRRARDLVLAAPILQVTLVSVVVYGSTRMRTSAQPAIAVLIAVGVVWVATTGLGLLRRTGRHPGPTRQPDPEPDATPGSSTPSAPSS